MKLFLTTLALVTFLFAHSIQAQDLEKGATLYKQCILCHGDKGDGVPAQKAPRISGQYDWYILKQLQDMKAQTVRKNPVMVPFLSKLSEQDMKDLAAYISKL
jgi:cytochrome c553